MKFKILFLFLMIFSSLKAQEKSMKLIQPAYLQKGDTVAILAPAGILKNKNEVVLKAKNVLEAWGLKVVLGKNMFNNGNHFAGSDNERCKDFQEALDNKNTKAILAARGGYGSVRIIDKLDFTEFKKNPKWVIGYSDITAFHNHIHNLGVETIHGMMATSFRAKEDEIKESKNSLQKVLFGKDLKYEIESSKYNRTSSSAVEGKLVGGNLAILTSMLGSESQISTDDKILFMEEIGEYKYAIDRMLQSLKRAGYFKNVKAVIVGNISNIKKNTTKWGSSIEQLILDVLPKDIPVMFDFPAGHEHDNRALIFGRNIQLTVNSGSKQSSVIFN